MTFIKYILFFAALLGLGGLSFYGCGKHKEKEITQIIDGKTDSARFYKDLYGSEHTQRLIEQGDRKILMALNKDMFDSVCRRLKIKEKQLKDVDNLITQSSGELTTPLFPDTVKITDTIHGLKAGMIGRKFRWANQYLQMNGFVDSVNLRLQYRMTLPITITKFWKRKWFLGHKHYYIDAFSPDKSTIITGIHGYKIN